MTNLPPKRGAKRPPPGGAPRKAPSAPPARTNPNRASSARQAREYERYDEDDRYYEDERYDRYEPVERPYRDPRNGPPSRRRYQPRYVAPRRDVFPILIGALVGMMVVGLLVIAYLLLTQRGRTTNVTTGNDTSASTTSQSVALTDSTPAQPSTEPTMAQSTNASGQQTMLAIRPANGLGTAVPNEGNNHVDEGQPITYVSYPPSSGTHYGSTAEYGFSEVDIPEGKLVHSLEHGAIVLYYKPDLPEATKQQLRDAYSKLPPGKYGTVKLVLTPYSNMQTPLAIAAWDRLLLMNEYNFGEIQTFYQTWVDKGPEDVP